MFRFTRRPSSRPAAAAARRVAPRPTCGVEPLEGRRMFSAVPVGNPSFESAVGGDDQPIGVAVWQIPGSIGNAFNPVNGQYPNATDTSPTHGNLPAPAAGRQVLFINNAGTARQTLSTTLAGNTSYTLKVAVGNRSDLVMENFRISLYAGNTLLKALVSDGETFAPNGGFRDATLTTAPVPWSSAAVGQRLRIELTNLSNKAGAPVQVNFDNVRLSSAVVPLAKVGPGSLPSAQGWQYLSGGQPVPESSVFSVVGGVTHQDTMGVGLNDNAGATGTTAVYKRAINVDPTLAYSVTVRARVTASEVSAADPARQFGFHFGVSNGQDRYAVAITESQVLDLGLNTMAAGRNNTVYHTYRLDVAPGGPARLYIDGAFVGTTNPTRDAAAGEKFVMFGDGSGYANARADLASLTVTQ